MLIAAHVALLASGPLAVAAGWLAARKIQRDRPAKEFLLASLPFLAIGVAASCLMGVQGVPTVEWIVLRCSALGLAFIAPHRGTLTAGVLCLLPISTALCANFLALVQSGYSADPEQTVTFHQQIVRAQKQAVAEMLQAKRKQQHLEPEPLASGAAGL